MRSEAEKHQDWLALQDKALAVAAEGITIADARLPDRPLIYVNEGFERLTGFTAREVLGRNCKFLQGDESDPDTVETMRRALGEGLECTVEILNHRKDGTPFWNRLSITPVHDEQGQLTHFIGVQSDVTSRRLAEEELRTANRQMKLNLEEAATIQQVWLPHAVPQVPGYEFTWRFQPCDDLAGDSLNILRLDEDHIGLYILDVCGHGTPAALLSASLNRWLSPFPEQSVLFEADPSAPSGYIPASPVKAVANLNRLFTTGPQTGKYFTFLYAVLNVPRAELRYITAGHPPPVRINAQGARVWSLANGIPIGVVPQFDFGEKKFTLEPGERVLFYTDGVFEAVNENDEEIGEQHLLDTLKKNHALPPGENLDVLIKMVNDWCPDGSPQDDVTLMAIDVMP